MVNNLGNVETLENENQTYIADVPCTTRVWLACPLVEIPGRKGNRGRIPTKQKVVDNQPTAIEVCKLANFARGVGGIAI